MATTPVGRRRSESSKRRESKTANTGGRSGKPHGAVRGAADGAAERSAHDPKAGGEAQLDDQIAAHLLDPTIPSDQATIARQRGLILKYASAPKLKHKELRNFLNRLFDLQLKRGPADLLGANTNPEILSLKGQALSSRPSLDAGLAAYFKAYYDDKFYNRMGGQIAKPQMPILPGASGGPISVSITDTDMDNAATVFLEFLIDSIDPTPVMGDTPTGDPATTTYYPGKSVNLPTALATNYVGYLQLNPDGCGITQKNAWVLKDLANLAGDQVGAISGLVVNSWGGFSFGAGAYLNFSVGDNQTLSDLLKTAASELAFRITLVSAYFSLRHISFNPPIIDPPGPTIRREERRDRGREKYPM